MTTSVARVAIKICGITTAQDITASVRAGATHVGLNFHSRSPRWIELAVAVDLAAAARAAARERGADVQLVGVFVDEPATWIDEVAERVALDSIQLHGDQGPAEVARFGARAWKALGVDAVSGRPPLEAIAEFATVGAFLLDHARASAAAPRGGSGRAWEFATAREFCSRAPTWLAGGLGADNVAAAIAAAGPAGVDACSRLERAPGIKDRERVEHFIAEVRRAETVDRT
jgi:phosphoribosylanthranilate isomerase